MGAISWEDWARLLAIIVSAVALVWGVWSYVAKVRLDHYTEFDKIYSDIVKLRITHTHLAIPPDSPSRDVKGMDECERRENELRYDAYALLIWNFIETFHDRGLKNRRLRETWMPIMEGEGKRHAKWLALNNDKFKSSFLKWANRTLLGVDEFEDDKGSPRSGAPI